MRVLIYAPGIAVAAAILSAASCSTSPRPALKDSAAVLPSATGGDTATLRAQMVKLEDEARQLARSEGCTTGTQCRTAPVGERPCGGPRTYLAYCAATTDSAALFRKLQELAATEKRYNALSGLGSTCEFRMPPAVELSGGSCRAAATAGMNRVP